MHTVAVVALADVIAFDLATAVEVFGRVVHGEQDFHFHRPIRPGDVLASRGRITGYETLPAGRMWLNQVWSGDMLNAVISYLPEGTTGDVLSYWYQQAGGPIFNDCICVASKATKPVIAHRFLNYILDNKVSYDHFTGYVGYQTPITAIDHGFSRALATIMESNITTFIAAAVLFYIGTGPVRGFAVTLGIGIITTVFTAFTLTRLIVATWVRWKRPQSVPI